MKETTNTLALSLGLDNLDDLVVRGYAATVRGFEGRFAVAHTEDEANGLDMMNIGVKFGIEAAKNGHEVQTWTIDAGDEEDDEPMLYQFYFAGTDEELTQMLTALLADL